MRRVGRIIFNVLTVLSLAMAIGVAVLWVRSYWVSDVLQVARPDLTDPAGEGSDCVFLATTYEFSFDAGVCYYTWSSHIDTPPGITVAPYLVPAGERNGLPWFEFHRYPEDGSIGIHALFLFAAAIAVPCARGILWFVRRKASALLCRSCGYDLRATPERCPECGTVPEATARSSPACPSSESATTRA